MARNNKSEKDELRARFTSWLNITLRNATNMYFRSLKNRALTIPLEELPLEYRIDPTNPYEKVERSADACLCTLKIE